MFCISCKKVYGFVNSIHETIKRKCSKYIKKNVIDLPEKSDETRTEIKKFPKKKTPNDLELVLSQIDTPKNLHKSSNNELNQKDPVSESAFSDTGSDFEVISKSELCDPIS